MAPQLSEPPLIYENLGLSLRLLYKMQRFKDLTNLLFLAYCFAYSIEKQ